jgi:hypothetical protein
MTSDPFTAFAQKHAPTREEKAAGERERLLDAHRRKTSKLLAGPHGADARALFEFLKHMELHAVLSLVERVQSGPWHKASAQARAVVLRVINETIDRLCMEVEEPPPGDLKADAELDLLSDQICQATFAIRKLLQ